MVDRVSVVRSPILSVLHSPRDGRVHLLDPITSSDLIRCDRPTYAQIPIRGELTSVVRVWPHKCIAQHDTCNLVVKTAG